MCLSTTRMYFLTVSWSSGCRVSTRGREGVDSVSCRVSMYHLVRYGFEVCADVDGFKEGGLAILCE
jgi:hypothetical protein